MVAFSPYANTILNLSAKIIPVLMMWEAGKILVSRMLGVTYTVTYGNRLELWLRWFVEGVVFV